jgi:hypothetical protein
MASDFDLLSIQDIANALDNYPEVAEDAEDEERATEGKPRDPVERTDVL